MVPATVRPSKFCMNGFVAVMAKVSHGVVKLGTATAALWSSPPQLAVTVKVL